MEERRLGVIDSLSAGLNLVSHRVWVVLIPMLLDLWYWLGPRLSIAPVLEQVGQLLTQTTNAGISNAPVNINVMIDMLTVLGQQLNLFSLLSTSLPLQGIPTLMVSGSTANVSVIEVRSWLGVISLMAPLVLAGFAIGCLYLTLIAQGLYDRPFDVRALLQQAGMMWLRVVALGLLILFLSMALMVPFLFLVGLLTIVSGGAASFLLGLFYVSIIWLTLYFFFVIDAIIINRVGPIRAIWNSANVVARNFWSALGLIVLIYILSLGLSLVWLRLGQIHPIGMFVGIAANAFIGSGLAAAGLLFYRDRYQRWQEQAGD